MNDSVDYVILGAGIFGLYAAQLLSSKGFSVVVVELEDGGMRRASYVNQARLHNGYHYPRSIRTASKSMHYYSRFANDFDFAINNRYRSIYAISSSYSYVNRDQFLRFAQYVGIPAHEVDRRLYFQPDVIEAAFETDEFSFDADRIRQFLVENLQLSKNCIFKFGSHAQGVDVVVDRYKLSLSDGSRIEAPCVINATYAGTNAIHKLFAVDPLPLKYELAEVILAKMGGHDGDVGITVMDGPFFSLIPFGLSGSHSITSVEFTPHQDSRAELPTFACQSDHESYCRPERLGNCVQCANRPQTSWRHMQQICHKFLSEKTEIQYERSLFTVKTVLSTTEVDDARPTLISELNSTPRFISIFSGKFNTIYDMEEVIA